MTDSQLTLSSKVQFLKGVGPRRAESFANLGIHTAQDLLYYFPRDYQFIPPVTPMNQLFVDQVTAVVGEIDTMQYVARSRPPRFQVALDDPTDSCRVVWFRGSYLKDILVPGDVLLVWGKVSRYKDQLQFVNPQWKKITDPEELSSLNQNGQPVYPATAELSSPQIARVVRQSLPQTAILVPERYSQDFLQEKKLPPIADALTWIHSPPDLDYARRARRRLAYDELFLMELALGLRREKNQHEKSAASFTVTEKIDKRIRRLFPFDFTDAQNNVLEEITADLAQDIPMNRLLQGDVGSGKTAVALYAALVAIAHRCQVAIMAPTEILAEQHYKNIEQYLAYSRVKRVLLTGGLTGSPRTALLDDIAQGRIDIIVGTQALIQKDVHFNNLALVIIDEQHKFGVRQRECFRSKDKAPHYLVMTATPIPRTLAMTVFGDLDVSVIDKLPPGRVKIETHWVKPEQVNRAYQFLREKIQQGQQAYFVYPRIDQSPQTEQDLLDFPDEPPGPLTKQQLKAAVQEQQRLQNEVFPEFAIGLLHGQMPPQQKQQVMDQFRNHKLDILVTTSVIEVGIDVPNANLMVIEHADYFGLAQLHQLRGRIGRGSQQSFCLLFGEAKNDIAEKRLTTMTQTTDGFKIAEIDLSIRGPGQFFGTVQHGLPELKIADILKDIDLLRMARRDAFKLAHDDPHLQAPQNQALKAALTETFGHGLDWIDVA